MDANSYNTREHEGKSAGLAEHILGAHGMGALQSNDCPQA